MFDDHTREILIGRRAPVWTTWPVDDGADRAAAEWADLCALLGLDPAATARGVVTEIHNLRRQARRMRRGRGRAGRIVRAARQAAG